MDDDEDDTSQTSNSSEDEKAPKDWVCKKADAVNLEVEAPEAGKFTAETLEANTGTGKVGATACEGQQSKPGIKENIEAEIWNSELSEADESETASKEEGVSECENEAAEWSPGSSVVVRRKRKLNSVKKRLSKCPKCGKVVSASNMSKHMKTHERVYSHQCDICGKMCRTRSDLRVHRMIHSGERPYVCRVCARGFVQKSQLLAHLTVHSDERKFLCSTCGAAFRQHASLSTHIKYHHTRERCHACQYCQRKFIEYSTMKIHERTHTAETPFLCSVCGKGFPSSGRLRIHTRIHTGEKPYVCQVCDKTFSQRSSLTRHIRVHTGARPYACQVCGKTFSQTGILDRHMRKHGGKPKKPDDYVVTPARPDIRTYYKERNMSCDDPLVLKAACNDNKDSSSAACTNASHSQIEASPTDSYSQSSVKSEAMRADTYGPFSLDSYMRQKYTQVVTQSDYSYHDWSNMMPSSLRPYTDYQTFGYPAQLPQSPLAKVATDQHPVCLKTVAETSAQPGYPYGAGMALPNIAAALNCSTQLEPTPSEQQTPSTESPHNDTDSQPTHQSKNNMNLTSASAIALQQKEELRSTTHNTHTSDTSTTSVTAKLKSKRKADKPLKSFLKVKDVKLSGSSRRKAGIRIRRVRNIIESSEESDSFDIYDTTPVNKDDAPKDDTTQQLHEGATKTDKKILKRQSKQTRLMKAATAETEEEELEEPDPSDDETYSPSKSMKKKLLRKTPKRKVKKHKVKVKGIKVKGKQKNKRSQCVVCDKMVRTDYMPLHMKRHAGHRPHQCQVCDKCFLIPQDLKIHMNIHLGEKPFRCFVCDKKFAQKAQLNAHAMIHTDERPCLCNVCGKAFRQKGDLARHMRSHTGVRPYVCSQCGRAFAESGTLTAHQRIHTGETPFICEVCGRGFKMRNILRTHMRTHDGEKPYSCDTCQKAFAQKSALTRHIRIHTGEKPCVCEVCGDRFTQTGILYRHMRKHGQNLKKPEPKANQKISQSQPVASSNTPTNVLQTIQPHTNTETSQYVYDSNPIDVPLDIPDLSFDKNLASRNVPQNYQGSMSHSESSTSRNLSLSNVSRNLPQIQSPLSGSLTNTSQYSINNPASPINMTQYDPNLRNVSHPERNMSQNDVSPNDRIISQVRNMSHSERNFSQNRSMSHSNHNFQNDDRIMLHERNMLHSNRTMSHSDRTISHSDRIISHSDRHVVHNDQGSVRSLTFSEASLRNMSHDVMRSLPDFAMLNVAHSLSHRTQNDSQLHDSVLRNMAHLGAMDQIRMVDQCCDLTQESLRSVTHESISHEVGGNRTHEGRAVTHQSAGRNMTPDSQGMRVHPELLYGQKVEEGDGRVNMLHSLAGPVYPPWPPGPGGFCY